MVRATDVSTAPRARNDPAQYDELVDAWWQPRGPLAMLHALAAARAARIPVAERPGSILVDLGCGGGLLGPYVVAKGYLHVGVDLTSSALRVARQHGVNPIAADVVDVPLADEMADVVVLGEILEHVSQHEAVAAEAIRVLRPSGTLLIDTIANTRIARFAAIDVAERIPGGAPKGIHDSRLFVDRRALVATCAAHGVTLALRGLRPTLGSMIGYVRGRRPAMAVIPTPSTAVLFQAFGTKAR